METITLNVEGMSCGHCKAAVEKAVKPLKGVQAVEATPSENKVVVSHDGTANVSEIKEAIVDAGYEVKA